MTIPGLVTPPVPNLLVRPLWTGRQACPSVETVGAWQAGGFFPEAPSFGKDWGHSRASLIPVESTARGTVAGRGLIQCHDKHCSTSLGMLHLVIFQVARYS